MSTSAPDTASRASPDGERGGGSARSTLLSRLLRPADDWADAAAGRGPRTLESLMALLLLTLVANAAVAGAYALGAVGSAAAVVLVLGLLLASTMLVLVLWYQTKRHLHEPLAQLHRWARGMCDGDLSTRIPAEQAGRFRDLVFHINRLSGALEHLANEMDDTVWRQTETLRLKNQSLETLYEVAATINSCDVLDEVLERSARTLMDLVGASGALVHVDGAPDAPPLVRRIGDAPHAAEAAAATETGAGVRHAGGGLVLIALTQKGERLGAIALTGAGADAADDPEKHKLLHSIGRHLGTAIAKARSDRESQHLSIMHERTAIASELHDSLAQTLLSLRYQTDTLADSLETGAGGQARREVERIRNTLVEANTELRELIANFRAPVAGRTLGAAVSELVERFRRDCPFAIFLQLDGALPELGEGAKLQIVRIVGEALANAQRHSGAKTVRVLLRASRDGEVEVLVEDDGVGMATAAREEHPGEHIGLAVMAERARWLGGTLAVESEPGEGTRVQLSFRAAAGGAPPALPGAVAGGA